jgi:hypothetical protein
MTTDRTLTAYRDAHDRCAVCLRPLDSTSKTIQHICRGTGRNHDPRNLVVCCMHPCHWARDGLAYGQISTGADGVVYGKLTDGQLLWCKLMEDGAIDLAFLTDLRRSLINVVIEPPPAEYMARRARYGR